MRIFSKKLLLVILATGLFLPVFDAYAQEGWFSGIAYGAASNLFAYSLQIVFSVIGTLMGALVQLLAWTVNIRIYTNVPVIEESWKIMRDFANMLFIIALIVMAYGTIFNIPKYDFKSLIPRFIVVAVLINFSLVLGGLMIDITQVLNNTFLAAMGDISGQLGQGLDVTTLLPDVKEVTESGKAISDLTFSSIINLLFGIFMFFAVLVSVAVPLVVSFVRIPILWALLIVSPMAWLLSILPATKGAFDNWWKQFLGWNLFLPYYLFSLYFALYFLGNMPKVIEGLGQTFVDSSLTGPGGNFTFSLIFSYALVAVFLIGGTKVAMNAGQFSGTGIISVAKWGRERAMRLTGAEGWRRGSLQKLQEIQKEGYGFGQYRFGGEKALEAEALRRARMLGTKGALEKGVEAEKEKQKPFAHDKDRLRDFAKSGSREQRLAARQRLNELGELKVDEVLETEKMYGVDREAANKFITSVDFSKYSEADRKRFERSLTNLEAKKKNALAMIEKDKLDPAEIDRMAEYFAKGELKEFLDKGNKKNLLAVVEAKVKFAVEGAQNTDEELQKAIKRMSEDDIVGMLNDPSFKFVESGPETGLIENQSIRRAFDKVLSTNPKKLENMAVKSTGKAQTMLESTAAKERTRILGTKIAPLTNKRQALENQLTTANQQRTSLLQQFALVQNYPTGDEYKRLQREINSKEGEINSLQNKIEKQDERIEDIALKQQP
ncbi:MAG: hypothetical protein HYX22_01365 [Candidatus Yanofskybacteria bacterium]|nr:hypothetical protein [Candidatus Yanofskybacteria bacterium]